MAVLGLGLFACNPGPREIAWWDTAVEHRLEVGAQKRVLCPAGGELSAVWGTDVYTDDSSICSAAVHAGKLNVDDGGEVTFEIRGDPGQYVGSTRNLVTTESYGSWRNAFVFVQ